MTRAQDKRDMLVQLMAAKLADMDDESLEAIEDPLALAQQMADMLIQARERAEAIAKSAMANMALEGQAVPPETYDRLYTQAFRNELNRARRT